jgi:hypothetical protein
MCVGTWKGTSGRAIIIDPKGAELARVSKIYYTTLEKQSEYIIVILLTTNY